MKNERVGAGRDGGRVAVGLLLPALGSLQRKWKTQIHTSQPKAFIETQGLSMTLLKGFILARSLD